MVVHNMVKMMIKIRRERGKKKEFEMAKMIGIGGA